MSLRDNFDRLPEKAKDEIFKELEYALHRTNLTFSSLVCKDTICKIRDVLEKNGVDVWEYT